LKRVRKVAGRLLVVDRLEREDDIGGRKRLAIRKNDAGPQLQGVAAPVGGAGPAFGEPRLDLLRNLINAYELRVGQAGQEVGRTVAGREPVEGARLVAD
jgi:hypothetical protein